MRPLRFRIRYSFLSHHEATLGIAFALMAATSAITTFCALFLVLAAAGNRPLAMAALAVGLGCYGGAFSFMRRQSEGSSDFRFLASLGLLLVLAGSALFTSRRPGSGPWSLLPTWILGLLALLGLGAFAVMASLAGAGPAPAPGTLAVLRTSVLAAMTLGAGALGRWFPASAIGWLTYPLLAATGLKLLLEDVPRGGPLTLSLAFTLFGAALLAAPRLLKPPAAPARTAP